MAFPAHLTKGISLKGQHISLLLEAVPLMSPFFGAKIEKFDKQFGANFQELPNIDGTNYDKSYPNCWKHNLSEVITYCFKSLFSQLTFGHNS